MRSFSGTLARWDALRATSLVLAAAWVLLVAAFAFAAVSVQPSVGAVVAAVASLPIAGAGFMYAWRNPASPADI